jgi:uncharacterized protein
VRRTALVAGVLAFGSVLAACGAGGGGTPRFTAPVVDTTGAIDDAIEQSLNAQLEEFRASVGPQIAVLVTDSTSNKSIEDYGIDIAREWGIGDKQRDDGVLLLIALDDRTLRIETGSGIEGDLTDVEAGRIIDGVVVPQLRNNDPTTAVANGVDALVTELSGGTYDYPDGVPPRGGSRGCDLRLLRHFDVWSRRGGNDGARASSRARSARRLVIALYLHQFVAWWLRRPRRLRWRWRRRILRRRSIGIMVRS